MYLNKFISRYGHGLFGRYLVLPHHLSCQTYIIHLQVWPPSEGKPRSSSRDPAIPQQHYYSFWYFDILTCLYIDILIISATSQQHHISTASAYLSIIDQHISYLLLSPKNAPLAAKDLSHSNSKAELHSTQQNWR